jgi:aminoglycoside/choline kinase family phosphotransferase
MKHHQTQRRIADLLLENRVISRLQYDTFDEACTLQQISSDGSLRCFYRIAYNNAPLCIAVLPAERQEQHIAEANSAMFIGNHLYGKHVAVPKILAGDTTTGLILFEDCGDIRLHDIMQASEKKHCLPDERVDFLYRKVLAELAAMQWYGYQGFDSRWCYDTAVYDHHVMVEKESKYFLRACWHSLFDGKTVPGIEEEFEDIARNAATGEHTFFLHRDFQSRNIMVMGNDVKIIDFQGGRLGPPGYDLASLLLDPYSCLSESVREEYLQYYLTQLGRYVACEEQSFRKQYLYLALQRNLQIIGAFAFLYQQRGKVFFKVYIIPALQSLNALLENPELSRYSLLRGIAEQALQQSRQLL